MEMAVCLVAYNEVHQRNCFLRSILAICMCALVIMVFVELIILENNEVERDLEMQKKGLERLLARWFPIRKGATATDKVAMYKIWNVRCRNGNKFEHRTI